MSENPNEKLPKIVKRQGQHMSLYPDVYFFCRCGLSKDGMFCDGSHKGTDFSPKRLKIDQPTSASFCLCKYSKNFPYCDGSHRSLK